MMTANLSPAATSVCSARRDVNYFMQTITLTYAYHNADPQ